LWEFEQAVTTAAKSQETTQPPGGHMYFRNSGVRVLLAATFCSAFVNNASCSGFGHYTKRLMPNCVAVIPRAGASSSRIEVQAKRLGARAVQVRSGTQQDSGNPSAIALFLPRTSQVNETVFEVASLPEVGRVAGVYEYTAPAPGGQESALPSPFQARNLSVGGITPPPFDTYYGVQKALTDINALAAWSITKGNPDLKVAIVGTGISCRHPELRDKIKGGRNFDRNNNDFDDRIGWGTYTAGLVGAATDNGMGIASVGWNVSLLACKIVDNNGNTNSVNAYNAIRWATDHDARVIVLMAAGWEDDYLVENAANYAREHGAVVITGTGTPASNDPNGPKFNAKDSPNIIFVSTDKDKDGNNIPLSITGKFVTLAAPGINVISTWYKPQAQGHHGDDCIEQTGTEPAGALVGGTAALMFSANPFLTPSAAEAILTKTATRLGSATVYGAGRVNAGAAVTLASKVAHITYPIPGTALSGSEVLFQWEAPAAGAKYTLQIGSKPGTANYCNRNVGTATSFLVEDLPANGSTLYVQLTSTADGDAIEMDSTNTAVDGIPVAMTSPINGSDLEGNVADFTFSPGLAVQSYTVQIYRSGVGFYLNKNYDTVQDIRLTNLPVDGKPILVKVITYFARGRTHVNSYSVNADVGTAATLLDYTPAKVLVSGQPATFNWIPGIGATKYELFIGTSPRAANLYNSNTAIRGGLGLSLTTTVPTITGRGICYVTLRTHLSRVGRVLIQDYTFQRQ
jgi:hypothetical protein